VKALDATGKEPAPPPPLPVFWSIWPNKRTHAKTVSRVWERKGSVMKIKLDMHIYMILMNDLEVTSSSSPRRCDSCAFVAGAG
jgi:hypothetical protein